MKTETWRFLPPLWGTVFIG